MDDAMFKKQYLFSSEIYTEGAAFGNHYRIRQYRELEAFIELMREKSDRRREEYLRPDFSSIANYEKDIRRYREDYRQMLGFPDYMFGNVKSLPDAEVLFVAEDGFGKIYRLNIFVSTALSLYGMLFLPKADAPYPLVIVQHGGGGTPEKCSEINGPSAYSNMVRRILSRGAAVFAPQLMTWTDFEHGPATKRNIMDCRLKQLGSSLIAVEIFKLMRSLDYLLARDDIETEKVGMTGLSYGGFYSLYTAAADVRIKSVLTSCCFNNKYIYMQEEMSWPDSAGRFLDAEMCALVCPRPLYIEVGEYDTVFDWNTAVKEYERAVKYYEKLGISDKIRFVIHPYSHVFDLSDNGIDFLLKGL